MIDTTDEVKQRALTTTAFAQHDEEFAFDNLQIDVIQDLTTLTTFIIMLGQVTDLDNLGRRLTIQLHYSLYFNLFLISHTDYIIEP
jgi:hypothetical protein